MEIKQLSTAEGTYPSRLKQIHKPPLLYVRGALIDADEPCFAVVGTRAPTTYGRQIVGELVEPLARAGLTIVSGLALGIDALAHEAALNAGGRTIAVLGGGVDDGSIYPVTNRNLAFRIIKEGGAVISEFPPGAESFKSNFPQRNRIISGLSLGVLIIEAKEDSGSLITARAALDQNREVFAVPGDITRATSIGPNNLIKMGARPVTTASDILDALGLENLKESAAARAIHPDSKEEAALLPHLSREPVHIDELVRASGLPVASVGSALTLMEIKGKIRHLGGMNYVIAS